MKDSKMIKINENPNYGFNFPFSLVIPKVLNENPSLVVACTLPRCFTDSSNSFDELIDKTMNDLGSVDPMHEHLSLENGNPMFIPCVPNIKEIRPGFLGKNVLYNNLQVDNNTFIKDVSKYYNLADQYKSMIEYAIEYLKSENVFVDDKVIVSGYSEGAKFASHFSLLHPEIIKCVVSGGTGGCISMPISELDGYDLPYPIGISDLANFDMDSFRKINFFYYMGLSDKVDSAIPSFKTSYNLDENGNKVELVDECRNPIPPVDENGNPIFIIDSNGNYTAEFNLFSDNDVNTINKTLGIITQDRFVKQFEIFKGLGLKCDFKMYPGNHITIFDNKDRLFKDVDNFIRETRNKNDQNLLK